MIMTRESLSSSIRKFIISQIIELVLSRNPLTTLLNRFNLDFLSQLLFIVLMSSFPLDFFHNLSISSAPSTSPKSAFLDTFLSWTFFKLSGLNGTFLINSMLNQFDFPIILHFFNCIAVSSSGEPQERFPIVILHIPISFLVGCTLVLCFPSSTTAFTSSIGFLIFVKSTNFTWLIISALQFSDIDSQIIQNVIVSLIILKITVSIYRGSLRL